MLVSIKRILQLAFKSILQHALCSFSLNCMFTTKRTFYCKTQWRKTSFGLQKHKDILISTKKIVYYQMGLLNWLYSLQPASTCNNIQNATTSNITKSSSPLAQKHRNTLVFIAMNNCRRALYKIRSYCLPFGQVPPNIGLKLCCPWWIMLQSYGPIRSLWMAWKLFN